MNCTTFKTEYKQVLGAVVILVLFTIVIYADYIIILRVRIFALEIVTAVVLLILGK